MTSRYIVASSGGFNQTDRWGVMKPGGIFLRALELTGKTQPRVLFIMTASGDDLGYIARSHQAMADLGVVSDHLALFSQPTAPVDESIAQADLVWVGGGSVANLLALWQLHGVDDALRHAWESGTVLGGVSAGSLCWHLGGPTDSFGPTLQVITNGMNLLPYGNGVHYDGEAQRRPLLTSLVDSGTLPLSFATDDHCAIVYEGIEPMEVVLDTPGIAARAYRVEKIAGEVVETVLQPGRL